MRAGGVGQLPAVHPAGQADIGDQKVDAGVRLQHFERRRPLAGLHRLIPQVVEDFRDQHSDGGFVIHDHDGLAGRVARRRRPGRSALVGVGLDLRTRQVDADHRPLARLGINPHLTARLARETIDHRQAQTRSLAHRLGREEGLERALHDLRRHARSGVGDAQRDVLAGLQVQRDAAAGVDPAVGGLDRQPTAIGHGVAGVDAEVEQRVFQLVRIGQHRPKPRPGHHLHVYSRPHGAPDQILHAAHQAVGVGRARIQRLTAGKGQQAVGQGRRAFRRLLRRGGEALHVGEPSLCDPLPDQVQAAADAGEQIVEVVGQASGQLADSLHLLGLPERLLGLHQLAGAFGHALLQRVIQRALGGGGAVALGFHGATRLDVQEHAREPQRRAVRPVIDAPIGLKPVVAPVGAAHPVLVGVGAAPADDVVDRCRQARLVVRVDGGHHLRQAQAFAPQGRVQAEGLGEGGVHREPVGGQIPHPGADDGAGGQRQLHPLHRLLRGGLGLSARLDVPEQHRHLATLGRLHARRRHLDVTPGLLEIALEPQRLAGSKNGAVQRHPIVRLRRSQIPEGAPLDVGDAGLALIAGVGLDVDVVAQGAMRPVEEFYDAEAVVDGVEQGPVAAFVQPFAGLRIHCLHVFAPLALSNRPTPGRPRPLPAWAAGGTVRSASGRKMFRPSPLSAGRY